MAHCIPSTVEDNPHASEGNSPPTTDIRAHSWFSPSQWTRGGTAARARPSAPSTHYLLLSSPYSLLSCPFVSIRGSEFFVSFVSFVVQSIRAHSCPFVVLSFSMDARRNRRAGAPKRAIHALPSPFFSLLPTFVPIRAHSWFKSPPGLRENWENIVNPWEL